MPWIMQMAGFALLLLGIGLALWVSFWVLIVLLVLAMLAVVWSHLRDYLLAKGILNPTPGVPPPADSPAAPTIEGDFKRVDSE